MKKTTIVRPQDCFRVGVLGRSGRRTVENLVRQKLGNEANIFSGDCYDLKFYQKDGWEELYKKTPEKFKKTAGFSVDELIEAEQQLRAREGLPRLLWGEEAKQALERSRNGNVEGSL